MATPVAGIRVDQLALCVTDGVTRVVGADLTVKAMATDEPALGYTDPSATQEADWPVQTDLIGRAQVWLPAGVYTWTVTFGSALVVGVFASSPAAFGRKSRGDAQLVRLAEPALPQVG